MRHFYLSPHPDDAALSCGGQIATLIGLGESVTIVTLLAGDPPEDFMRLPAVPHTEKLWERWQLGRGSAATEGRRAEDLAAAHELGAAIQAIDWPEAIYRTANGRALYTDHDAIFGDLNPADPLVLSIEHKASDLMARLDLKHSDVLHIPLGVGHHVDHQWTRQLGQAIEMKAIGIDLRYYEEYPYSVREPDAVSHALTLAGIAKVASPVIHAISPEALAVKIAAIGCYRSQLSSLWSEIDQMPNNLKAYSDQVGGEQESIVPAKFR